MHRFVSDTLFKLPDDHPKVLAGQAEEEKEVERSSKSSSNLNELQVKQLEQNHQIETEEASVEVRKWQEELFLSDFKSNEAASWQDETSAQLAAILATKHIHHPVGQTSSHVHAEHMLTSLMCAAEDSCFSAQHAFQGALDTLDVTPGASTAQHEASTYNQPPHPYSSHHSKPEQLQHLNHFVGLLNHPSAAFPGQALAAQREHKKAMYKQVLKSFPQYIPELSAWTHPRPEGPEAPVKRSPLEAAVGSARDRQNKTKQPELIQLEQRQTKLPVVAIAGLSKVKINSSVSTADERDSDLHKNESKDVCAAGVVNGVEAKVKSVSAETIRTDPHPESKPLERKGEKQKEEQRPCHPQPGVGLPDTPASPSKYRELELEIRQNAQKYREIVTYVYNHTS